jgi:hypothetical protein
LSIPNKCKDCVLQADDKAISIIIFNAVIKFRLGLLTDLFESGLTYSSINCARSALSAFGIMLNGVTVNAKIIRFMKGVYLRQKFKCKDCVLQADDKAISIIIFNAKSFKDKILMVSIFYENLTL